MLYYFISQMQGTPNELAKRLDIPEVHTMQHNNMLVMQMSLLIDLLAFLLGEGGNILFGHMSTATRQ
jgi:hypothetical protein